MTDKKNSPDNPASIELTRRQFDAAMLASAIPGGMEGGTGAASAPLQHVIGDLFALSHRENAKDTFLKYFWYSGQNSIMRHFLIPDKDFPPMPCALPQQLQQAINGYVNDRWTYFDACQQLAKRMDDPLPEAALDGKTPTLGAWVDAQLVAPVQQRLVAKLAALETFLKSNAAQTEGLPGIDRQKGLKICADLHSRIKTGRWNFHEENKIGRWEFFASILNDRLSFDEKKDGAEKWWRRFLQSKQEEFSQGKTWRDAINATFKNARTHICPDGQSIPLGNGRLLAFNPHSFATMLFDARRMEQSQLKEQTLSQIEENVLHTFMPFAEMGDKQNMIRSVTLNALQYTDSPKKASEALQQINALLEAVQTTRAGLSAAIEHTFGVKRSLPQFQFFEQSLQHVSDTLARYAEPANRDNKRKVRVKHDKPPVPQNEELSDYVKAVLDKDDARHRNAKDKMVEARLNRKREQPER